MPLIGVLYVYAPGLGLKLGLSAKYTHHVSCARALIELFKENPINSGHDDDDDEMMEGLGGSEV